MNDYIKNIIPRIQQFSFNLNEKEKFIDKPWAVKDNRGNLLRYTFKRDNRLLMTQNGIVQEGSWEFINGINGIFLKIKNKKVLLRHLFMDEKLLVLKLDGPSNEWLILANEQKVPDLNALEHLEYLSNGKQPLITFKSTNGKEYRVINGGRDKLSEGDYVSYQGEPANGEILTKSGKVIYAEEGYIEQIFFIRKFTNGNRHFIAFTQSEEGFQQGDIIKDSIGPILDYSIKVKGNITLYLNNGVVKDIFESEASHQKSIDVLIDEDSEDDYELIPATRNQKINNQSKPEPGTWESLDTLSQFVIIIIAIIIFVLIIRVVAI